MDEVNIEVLRRVFKRDFDVVVLKDMKKNQDGQNNGYTLIEIVVTMIVLGILASLAIPRYLTSMERVKSAEGVQILESLLNAQRRYLVEYDTYTSNINDLDIEFSGGTGNFNTPTVSANPNRLAIIVRPKLYQLSIKSDGVISCNDRNNSGTCVKLGCNPQCPQ